MQILVVFVILGIGADDCFVFVDAWKQSLLLHDDVHKRLQYAYARALQSMANTSLTTAAAFLATAISPIMPIAAFGIYAAICVLTVSYTHLRAHETREDLVCRLLLEKKKK